MLRIGIIGTNFISHRMMDAVKKTDGVIAAAVYSRTKETGDAFAAENGIPAVFTELDALLSYEGIDAVYIASPNYCHHTQAIAALQHKKHVLVEKPAAYSLPLFREMKKAASEHGCILLEAMRPLFSPTLAAVKEALPLLGKLRSAYFSFCQYSSRYDRFKAGDVMNAFDPALANAALLDIGIYPIALLHALLGAPQELACRSVFLKNGFEGRGSILARYPEMLATVDYSKIDAGILPSVIIGENGSLTIRAANTVKEVSLQPRDGEERLLFSDPEENNMCYELAAFRDMAEGLYTPDAYHRETEGTLGILDKIRRQSHILFPGIPED